MTYAAAVVVWSQHYYYNYHENYHWNSDYHSNSDFYVNALIHPYLISKAAFPYHRRHNNLVAARMEGVVVAWVYLYVCFVISYFNNSRHPIRRDFLFFLLFFGFWIRILGGKKVLSCVMDEQKMNIGTFVERDGNHVTTWTQRPNGKSARIFKYCFNSCFNFIDNWYVRVYMLIFINTSKYVLLFLLRFYFYFLPQHVHMYLKIDIYFAKKRILIYLSRALNNDLKDLSL